MEELRRVLIWSGWLRVSHWAIALATMVLMITGWLIGNSPLIAETATEFHYLASSILIFGLVIRIVLMFKGHKHEKLQSLIPEPSELRQIKETILFYLSLGKRPLPNWFAHNPLWKVVYLFFYLMLILMIVSGGLINNYPVVFGFYQPSVHTFWATAIFWFVVMHLISLFVHDYYAKTTDTSAMINGYRLFSVDKASQDENNAMPVVIQSMDSLISKNKME